MSAPFPYPRLERGDGMADVHDVAAFVLEKLGPTSAMKLQKIVYYCQAWHLARIRQPLFLETTQALREGPVVAALYKRHRQVFHVGGWPGGDGVRLAASEAATVRWVCERYGDLSANELSEMTRRELPWIMARGTLPPSVSGDKPVSTDIMANFYSRQIAPAESAVLHAVSNAAMEGIDLDYDWIERLRDVATGSISTDTLIAEEVARLKNGR